MNEHSPSSRLVLSSVAGPSAVTLPLAPPGPLTIGRRPDHDLQLDDPVSRDHAALFWENDHEDGWWFLTDTGSKHGTRLNGVALREHRRYPLRAGDLIEITPWTLRVVDPSAPRLASTLAPTLRDDESHETIALIPDGRERDASWKHLQLLLQCARSMHLAKDEAELAETALNALLSGTGFPNAAFLGPGVADGNVTLLSHRGAVLSDPSRPRFSRSLIERAGGGFPARLTRDRQRLNAASIVELGIDEALCVPLMLGATVAGYLYLDSRRSDGSPPARSSHDVEFALGVGELAAMALANLKRLELQQRFAGMEADLAAASEAQRWVLPKRQGRFDQLAYIGESRPGRAVSGDFFDVHQLDEQRTAVTLGDVAGKGMAASVLMTAAQGFLHAAMTRHGDPARAVTDLNDYVQPRCESNRFLTLWAGVIDRRAGILEYVDAGHGFALLLRRDGERMRLNEGEGVPVGVIAESRYESIRVPMGVGDRLLIVSDGLIEQPAPGKERIQFGFDRLLEVLSRHAAGETGETGGDEVTAIFDAVMRHAGSAELADDATAVLARWC